jgi:phytoene synthase
VTKDALLEQSYRFCSAVARREARNFYLAFLLLPRVQRRSMCALYAFMRHTDNLADEPAAVVEKNAALGQWKADLDAALAGAQPRWPGLLALADTVSRSGVPVSHLQEVISGVCMDVSPRRYATFNELRSYCYLVASAVGLCCIHIWGYDSDGGRAEKLAAACGTALQLTNIIRDVREDADRGRIYLPEDDMNSFGVKPKELKAERTGPALRALLQYEACRAYELYDQAQDLVSLVEPVGRPVLMTIVGIYRALLDEIVRRDYDVLPSRIAIPAWRKAVIALRTIPLRFQRPAARRTPTLVP